jgi:ferredoxin-NADP reductase
MTSTTTIVREFEADLVVTEVEIVAEDVVALTLADPAGAALPAWTPGAHIDLVVDENHTRQYSLCGLPSQAGQWRVAVLKAPDSRGGSVLVHDTLQAGATVRVRGPRNHFPLVASRRYLFIAGGIGITPLLPMIAEVAASGIDWQLVYGGRTRSSMAFAEELADYGDRVTIVAQDEAGMPDLDAILADPQPGTLVYCCGPEGLLSAVEKACAHWPAGSLHLERFAAKVGSAGAGSEQTDDEPSFEVVLQRSGLTLTVPPGRSIFDVVRDAGVSVLGSCLEGICGTCETEVLDGEVEHRDSVLTAEEQESNEFMMICVSRCRSARLTLDL